MLLDRRKYTPQFPHSGKFSIFSTWSMRIKPKFLTRLYERTAVESFKDFATSTATKHSFTENLFAFACLSKNLRRTLNVSWSNRILNMSNISIISTHCDWRHLNFHCKDFPSYWASYSETWQNLVFALGIDCSC